MEFLTTVFTWIGFIVVFVGFVLFLGWIRAKLFGEEF